MRSMFAGAGAGGFGGGFPGGFGGRRSAAAGSTSPTCSATCSTGRRRRRLRHPHPAPPACPRRGRRDRDHARLRRRRRRHHDQPAAQLGRALPDVLRHRRQARHPAARVRHLRGRRRRGQLGRRRLLDERDLSGVPRPPAGVRRAVPDLPRLAGAACPAARSRRASRPGSRTASASGSRARAPPARTAARRATCSSPCTSAAHRDLRPQGRQPDPRGAGDLRRGRPRVPRSRCPTLGGPPVTLRIPPGTPNGRVLRVRGRGAPRKDGSKGDLLVTVDVQVPDDPGRGHPGRRSRRTARRASGEPTRAPPVPGRRVMPATREPAAGGPRLPRARARRSRST